MNVAVVLAGGKGTRMNRKNNKVLETICGKPIISHIIDILLKKNIKTYVVIGQNGELIKKLLQNKVEYIFQPTPLGTGHALKCACEQIKDKAKNILVLNGDGPIFESALIEEMLDNVGALKLLIGLQNEEHKFGRIIRENGNIANIIEAKDCTQEQLAIKEANLGIYSFNFNILCKNIAKIDRNNAQNEYYVTDLVKLYYNQKLKITGVCAKNYFILNGVNTIQELNKAENEMRKYINRKLANNGVRLIDENNTYIDCDVEIKKGCTIYPNVHICGKTTIGENVTIFPNTFINNCTLHNDIFIGANSVIDGIDLTLSVKHGTTMIKD